MTRTTTCAALTPLLMLLACEPAAAPRQPEDPGPAAAPSNAPAVAAEPAPAAAASGSGDGTPDLTPPPLTPAAEAGETGARNILLSFARAIELAEYGQAWTLLGAADRQRWSQAAFAAMFADLADVTVAIPTGTLDGAAGESRYTAPVTITGRDPDGRPVRLEGTAMLRQAAGAAGEPPRWRFETLSLDVTH